MSAARADEADHAPRRAAPLVGRRAGGAARRRARAAPAFACLSAPRPQPAEVLEALPLLGKDDVEDAAAESAHAAAAAVAASAAEAAAAVRDKSSEPSAATHSREGAVLQQAHGREAQAAPDAALEEAIIAESVAVEDAVENAPVAKVEATAVEGGAFSAPGLQRDAAAPPPDTLATEALLLDGAASTDASARGNGSSCGGAPVAAGAAQLLNEGLVAVRTGTKWVALGGQAVATGVTAMYALLPPPFPGPAKTHEPPLENFLNVITSVPFLWLGMRHFPRDTAPRRHFANGICAVGLASMLFHSSSGDLRPHTRRLDYVSIALNTTALSACVAPKMPSLTRAVSLALAPAFPLAVIAAQTAVVEHQFAQLAIEDDKIRRRHLSHVASSLASGLFWLGEESVHWSFHPLWHLTAAWSLGTLPRELFLV